MSLPDKNEASQQFTIAARRNKLAEDYFTSERFLKQLTAVIEKYLVAREGMPDENTYIRNRYAELEYPDVQAIQRDMPLLQKVFEKLKEQYPELDHIRVHSQGSVIVDTKPNNWWRRNISAAGLRGVTPPF